MFKIQNMIMKLVEILDQKAKNISNKLDNSMGLPSQVYGTEELKNSISSSFSGLPHKGITRIK